MTTTPELHELAKDPQAFDTALAALHGKRSSYADAVARDNDRLHRLAGDNKSYRNTRVPVWGMGRNEVEQQAQRALAHGDDRAYQVLTSRATYQAIVDAIDFEIANMDAVYMRQGNRWTRFFPSVTKSQPHIHRSLSCHTLHPTTVMTWAPALSGKTEAEAVEQLDEALCTVCFPSAPVALHNYVSKSSTWEREQREMAKAERDAKRAAKTLDPQTEAFKTAGRFPERVTTVAACKELIRKAVEQAVEVDFYDKPERDATWPGDPSTLANVRRNVMGSLEEARKNAAEARRVLIAREAAHEGWGMTEADIDAMMARKDKAARKEWGL